MKRLFTLLTFVLLTMSAIAQQRMNFLGQPLGCSITTFKQRMASKGYKYDGEHMPNIHSFNGVFGGDQVHLAAYVTPKSKIVYEVGVVYLDYYSSNSKESMEFKKNSLIQSFVKKYGNYSEKDIYTFWLFSYGRISISLDYENILPLRIFYTDKLGEEMCEREQESDY